MTRPCPSCASPRTTTIDTDRHASGTTRRRYECRDCGHRWTVYDGPPPPRGGAPGPYVRPRTSPTDDDIYLILTSPLNDTELSRQIGRHRQVINDVRCGRTFVKIHPELPRRQRRQQQRHYDGPSCEQCQHWTGRCGMGFPDPAKEGPRFAADCSLFEVTT